MAWLESHDDIWDHHKTIKLSKKLSISKVQAVGHLTSLWHFVLRNAWETADLAQWGDDGIEDAGRWEGNAGEFVTALRETGWLDNSVVHGWMERAGQLVYDRLRKKDDRDANVRKLSRTVPGQSRTISGPSEATVPYTTVPNTTVPNPTKKLIDIPPPIGEVKVYCAERNKGIDPDKFFDHYAARGWMIGKNKMKDWKAAVRTWEKNNGNYQAGYSGRIVGHAKVDSSKYDGL